MFLNIDPLKSAFASLLSVTAGTISNYIPVFTFGFVTLETANTLFQHAAWIVAILAGLVSIVNGVKTWKIKKKKNGAR